MPKKFKIDTGSLYLFFLILMVVSLPLSRFGLSVAQFSLLGLWLLEGKYLQKVKSVFSSPPALALIAFYLLHVIGLLYTTNFDYALKDLRIKLPLLFLPVIFVSSEKLRNQKTDLILMFYIGALMVASFVSTGILFTKEIDDFRELSPFISHIRLSLNVCIGIFFSLHFAFARFRDKILFRNIFIGVALWLILFLVMIESFTGLIVLVVTGIFLLGFAIFSMRKLLYKIAAATAFFALPLSIFIYLHLAINNYLNPDREALKHLDTMTAEGNYYWHDTVDFVVENGSYIGTYICEPELREAWNKRSNLDYDGQDEKGQQLKYTLFRYLNSKGLRKDAAGLSKLTDHDVRNVEMGIANYYYTKKISLNARLYKILWEYQVRKQQGNPGGHTLMQRLEYWKTSWSIIRRHFFFGVGTGDVQDAFDEQYNKSNSPLTPEYRHRSHNQYLAVFITFGITGLFIFLFSLIYPPIKLKRFLTFRYFVFWMILVLSMMAEDTLETQMGVTLFAFFNTFLLFSNEEIKKTGHYRVNS